MSKAPDARAVGGRPLHELARLRQAAYRLLGAVLLGSGRPLEPALAAAAPILREETAAAFAPFPFFAAWGRLLDALEGAGAATVPALDRACESAYGPPDNIPWIVAGLGQEYGKAGFIPAEGLAEPPDHAGVELEFASLLCADEARACERRDASALADCLRRESAFLDGHLARWLPLLAAEAAQARPGGLAALAAETAWRLVAHDRDLLRGILAVHEAEAVA